MAVVLKKQTSSAGVGLAVDVALLIEQPKAALLPVLRKLDGWHEAVEETITVEQFSGAMTNMVYRCGLTAAADSDEELQVVLMRVHASSSDLFDRDEEIATFRGVSAAGMGPKLLLLFDNGRVEEFLAQHVTLAASDLQDTIISSGIAATMAHFHVTMSAALGDAAHLNDVLIWSRLRSWLDLVKEHIDSEELERLGMSQLDTEIDRLEEIMMISHPCWIALCHNDLQYGNIMALADSYGSSSVGGTAAAEAAAPAEAAVTNPGQAGNDLINVPGLHPDGSSDQVAAAAAADMLGTLQLGGSAAAAAAAGSSEVIEISSHALKQHHDDQYGSASQTHLSAEDSYMAVAGTSPAHSVTSVGSFGHRAAGPSVQLSDGSIVLPGMRARPRGQSPERGKRPDYVITSSSSDLAAAISGRIGSELATAASSSSLDAAMAAAAAAAGIKPPSAAAVLRHAPSAGHLTFTTGAAAGGADTAAVAAAAAAAAAAGSSSSRARRQRISSSGLDTSESAEDSEEADGILPNQAAQSASAAESGFSNAKGVAAAAAAADNARTYRQIRKARKTPPAGYEFPSFEGSDVDESSSSSSSDYGADDDSSSGLDDDEPCFNIGGSTSSFSHNTAAAAAADPAAAAAGLSPAVGTWDDKSLTLIDYEYAGFNPVAFDIANHWCEWAADYHTDEPHVLNFNRLPTQHQQLVFVQEYLQALLTGLGITVPAAAGAAAAAAAGSSAAGQQQQRPEDLWSVISSIGGSVYSIPENEASYRDTDTMSVKSFTSTYSEQQQQLPKLATLAAAAAGESAAAAAVANPGDLRNIWRWIDLYQPDRALLLNHKTLDVTCYNRLCHALTEASRAYMAASHLLWALWGVIQTKVSDVDFDFEGYGQQRWNMYLATRPPALQQQQQQQH